MELMQLDKVDISQCQVAEAKTIHSFNDGMYMRETSVKAGTLVIGCTHKKDSFAILAKGRIVQLDGSERYEIEAPATIITKAGSQRKAYAIEDATYITVNRTDATTVEEVEAELYEETPMNSQITNDFQKMILEIGITEEEIQAEMDEVGYLDIASDDFYISDSTIQGKGIFAGKSFEQGDFIGIAKILNSKTTIGRFTNHSPYSNAEMIVKQEGVYLYATQSIQQGEEITTNYKTTLQRIQQCQQ